MPACQGVRAAQERRTEMLRSKTAAANAPFTRAQCRDVGRLFVTLGGRPAQVPPEPKRCQNERRHPQSHIAPGASDTESINKNGYTVSEQESQTTASPYARGVKVPSQIILFPRSTTLVHFNSFNSLSHPSGVEVFARRLIGTCTRMSLINQDVTQKRGKRVDKL